MVWLVRDYDRLKFEYNAMIDELSKSDGQPKSNIPGDPTASKAMRRETLDSLCKAVESGLLDVPKEYRYHVFNHVKYNTMFPNYADRKTWFLYQSAFLYSVAEKLGEI